MNYYVWKVKDKELRCRLDARNCVDLEKKLGTNPVNKIFEIAGKQEMPSLSVLLEILQYSLQSLEHGITMQTVYNLFDEFVDEGHTTVELVPIIMDIFRVSGFVSGDEEEKN